MIPAVQAVIELLTSTHPMVRLKAAKIILAKRIPDLTNDTARPPMTINIIIQGPQAAQQMVQVFSPLPKEGGADIHEGEHSVECL